MEKKYQFKRPEFIIFTDKDGTLNLDDDQLSMIFRKIQMMNGIVIPITGRTVGDIIEELDNNDIPISPIIIGDNGGAIYSTIEKAFIQRKIIDHERLMRVLDYFIEIGGDPELIRCTDGKFIYASDNNQVRGYYKKSKNVKHYKDVYHGIKNTYELSKITLAGPEEQMRLMTEFVSTLGFWTDMDKTKFPNKKDKNGKNYRLDITLRNINKGEAVRAVTRALKPKFYVCIGDGKNDVSMFRQALEDNQELAIMGGSTELIREMRQYQSEIKRGVVRVIPNSKNLANRSIVGWMDFIQNKKRNEQFRKSLIKRAHLDSKNNRSDNTKPTHIGKVREIGDAR